MAYCTIVSLKFICIAIIAKLSLFKFSFLSLDKKTQSSRICNKTALFTPKAEKI